MSPDSEPGAGKPASDRENLDHEHRIQIDLLDALTEAVRGGRPQEEMRVIHERLLEYSRMHFLSEQLSMRLHSYPEYERHVTDHEEMIRTLEDLAAARDAGWSSDETRRIRLLRAFLIGHIDGRDRAFGEYLSKRGGDPADG